MEKVYLDMNIFVQLKNGRLPLLESILRSGNYSVWYSTAHIGDILSNEIDEEELELIKTDLDFISEITGNNCLANTGSDVTASITHPEELFNERYEDRDLLKGFSLDKMMEQLKEFPEIESEFKPQLDNLKNMSFTFFDALNHPESASTIKLMFPGLKENPTFNEYLKSFGDFIMRMNESDDYNNLRHILQSGFGINRDKMFNTDVPFEKIQKIYDKHDVKFQHPSKNKRSGPTWFNQITDKYLILDMHGFQEDKIIVTEKEEATFKNTTQDAFHAAFASKCDIYITNDKRAYLKTKEVYKKLKILTLVFKPDEFLKFLNQ